MKILILGATGNIGSLVASTLTFQHPEISLRLNSSRAHGVETLKARFSMAEVCFADWYAIEQLVAALEGVDKVVVVAPDFVTDEKRATGNLIEAIHLTGRLIQIIRLIAIPPGFTASHLTPEQLDTRCGAALHVVAKPLLDASGVPVTYINVACWIMFNLPWFMAEEVKRSQRLVMPKAADAARQWCAEGDIAEVIAKIVSDPASPHSGKEYLLSTNDQRHSFEGVAELISDVLDKKITYVDDNSVLKQSMGDHYDRLMTYFTHETRAYREVPQTKTIQVLLGRPQVHLRQYIEANRSLFE